jgi:hypothetical protein
VVIGAVLAALGGAFFFGLAAAVQQREALATHSSGVADPRLLWRLLRRPWWIAGVVFDVLSAVLHGYALALGSVNLVQPLGVTGLLFAIPVVAFLRRQRIPTRDLLASLLVLVALFGVLQVFPPAGDGQPSGIGGFAVLVGVTLGIGAVATVVAHFAPGRPRALLLAASAGGAFGVTAVLGRWLLGTDSPDRGPGVIAFGIGSMVVLVLFGYLCLQNAYRAGHFAGSLATAVVVDPIAAVFAGAHLLDEPLPSSAGELALLAVCTLAICAGVALLVRSPAHLLEVEPVAVDSPEPSAEQPEATDQETGR